MPSFRSFNDEKIGTEYISELLDEIGTLSSDKANQILAADKARAILENRKEVRDKYGQDDAPTWNSHEIDELVREVIIAKSGIDPDTREKVDSPGTYAPTTWEAQQEFILGEWELKQARSLTKSDGKPLGYSPNDELHLALVPPGGGATMHIYDQVPASFDWDLTKIEQKGYEFLVGKAKVCEIESVCSVPSLPEEMDSEESGKRVLDPNRGKNEWQRIVNPKRIISIEQFITDRPENIIANSALLYCPEGSEAVTCSEDGNVSVDFSKFLAEVKLPDSKNYYDHWIEDGGSELVDRRPIWLIDGQHRTRGLARNELSSEMEIPVIVFTDEFSLSNAAKIFAEINTLQKPLDKLHTLFMRHRFKIPNSRRLDDFRDWDINDDKTHESRQNNLAYECAGWLTSNPEGPLYNRIKILPQNKPRFTIIKANSWTEYSRYWFKSQPYGPDCDLTRNEIFQEVQNYFQAFVNTCNHSDWDDDRNRWSMNSSNKGILQTHSSSRILLDIYGDVWEKAAMMCKDKIIPINVFEEVLKPLRWVDWLDSELYSRYHGGGEPPRSSLRIWIKAAIQNGVSYKLDDVMSSSHKSIPGKGILAPPEDSPIINHTPKKAWPVDDDDGAVVLVSTRPEHSRAGSRWVVSTPNGREYGPSGGYKREAAVGEFAIHNLEYEDWMDDVDQINVKVSWINVNRPDAIGTITLKKPSN